MTDTFFNVCASGITEEVERLSKNKAKDINRLDKFTGLSGLHYAARAGKNAVIDTLFIKHDDTDVPDINCRSSDGATPLHWACMSDKPETVSCLLKYNPLLDERGSFGRSALHICAYKGHLACMSKLLEVTSIDVNLSDNLIDPKESGMTALHLAVSNADIKCVELLLVSGANVTAKNSKNQTPLHLACCTDSLDLVRLLLKAGKENNGINDKDIDGATPLLHACYHRQKDIVDLLCKETSIDVQLTTNSGETALFWAAAGGCLEIVKKLIKSGADISKITNDGRSALHAAARTGHHDTCEVLINTYCNIEAKDNLGLSPLALAARYGQLSVVKYLMDAGANIQSRDITGASPLFHAVQENQTDVTKCLADKMKERGESEISDDKDNNFDTPLHIAAEKGYHLCLEHLLTAGYRMEKKNKDGFTAPHLAAREGRIETMRLLMKNSKECVKFDDDILNQPLHMAAKHGYVQICRLLLLKGAQVNKSNIDGVTPLHMAAECGGSMVCDVLIVKKAVINVIDKNNNTPLHYATRAGDEETTSLLVEYGAQLDMINQLNENALLTAIKSNNQNCVSAILNCPNWKDSFEAKGKDLSNLHQLIIHFPDHAQSVFDKCTEADDNISSESNNFWVKFHYSLLEDQKDDPFSTMLEHERIQLLDHPLVSSLLTYKWVHYGRILYFWNLFIYICYLVTVTCHCMLESPNNEIHSSEAPTGLAILVVTFSIVRLLFECVEAVMDFSSYIRSFTNYIEVILYILSIVFVSNSFYSDLAQGSSWHWEIGCFVIVLAWLCLALFLRKSPSFGSHVIMFTTVFKSFIKIFPFILIFLIAFSLAFHMCLGDQYGTFRAPGYSLVKTMMMLMGEFNFDMYFVPQSRAVDSLINYPYATYTILPLFVICMPLLLMNLLVGLAVDDISLALAAAKLQRSAKLVEAVFISQWFLEYFTDIPKFPTKKLFPNKKSWYLWYPYEFRGSHVEEILKRKKHEDDSKTHAANHILSTLTQIKERLAAIFMSIKTKDDLKDVLENSESEISRAQSKIIDKDLTSSSSKTSRVEL